MTNYFKWVFHTVHAQEPTPHGNNEVEGLSTSTASQPFPWYVIPPPKDPPAVYPYNASSYSVHDIYSIILNDLRRDLHFSMKTENTGDEGLYGLLNYCQLPDVELGLDIDVAAFIAGAISCTLMGLYLDDIYKPRKLMVWWPTRWFFNFIEEGIYLGRTLSWLANAMVIITKTTYRATHGGMTHILSRWLYYWLRRLITRNIPYAPLLDDTFASLISGYVWTSYTLESEEHTTYDRIICVGWSAVFTGLLEFLLCQYFLKNPPPGLFRWLFGGAFYGPGVWRYLQRNF